MNDEKQDNQQPSPKAEEEVKAQENGAAQGAEENEVAEANAEAQDKPSADDVTIESLLNQIESLNAENQDLKDKLLRQMAEMENLRRRKDREIEDKGKYAISSFAKDILSVPDNLQRAIEAVPAEAVENDPPLKTLLEGVQMTDRELQNALERHGITKLDPLGQAFDPNLHQAMFEVEDPEKTAGTVMQVVQAGYVIGDRTLRPAMVGVSKGGPKAPKPEVIDGEAEAPKEEEVSASGENGTDKSETEAPKEANDNGAGEGEDNGMGAKVDKSA